MSERMDALFYEVPKVVAASSTTLTDATVAGTAIPASIINLLPGEAGEGLTFRFTLAGTKTGTNAAHIIYTYLGSTAIQTLTADDTTAVEWMATIVVRFSSGAAQKVMGMLSKDTADPDVSYDAGTTSAIGGNTLKLVLAAGHTSDSVTCELITVERWVK